MERGVKSNDFNESVIEFLDREITVTQIPNIGAYTRNEMYNTY